MNMELMIEKIKKHGYKITLQRRLILEALSRAGKPQTAQEVYQYIIKKVPGIGFDTVYRNLVLLDELGIVNRLNFKTRFSTRFELFAGSHRHHLVCLGCGKNIPIDYCPFNEYKVEPAEREYFRVTGHVFEVYGYCRECDSRDD